MVGDDMGIARVVNTDFWLDDKIVSFSPMEKYIMVYLLTNSHGNQLGIYEINPRIISFETGVSEDVIESILNKLENNHGVIIRRDNEIAIKNFLRYSVIKGGKPVSDCLNGNIRNVKHKELVDIVAKHVLAYSNISVTVKEVLSAYLRIGDVYVEEVKQEVVEETSLEPVKEKVNKISYAESVKMTEVEYNRLIERVGSEEGAKRCIEILDNYKIGYGRKYKNDYRAILSWVIDKYEQEKKMKVLSKGRRTQGMSAAQIAEETERIMNGGDSGEHSANIVSIHQGLA